MNFGVLLESDLEYFGCYWNILAVIGIFSTRSNLKYFFLLYFQYFRTTLKFLARYGVFLLMFRLVICVCNFSNFKYVSQITISVRGFWEHRFLFFFAYMFCIHDFGPCMIQGFFPVLYM